MSYTVHWRDSTDIKFIHLIISGSTHSLTPCWACQATCLFIGLPFVSNSLSRIVCKAHGRSYCNLQNNTKSKLLSAFVQETSNQNIPVFVITPDCIYAAAWNLHWLPKAAKAILPPLLILNLLTLNLWSVALLPFQQVSYLTIIQCQAVWPITQLNFYCN